MDPLLRCDRCGKRAPYCDDCLAQVKTWFTGPATTRGALWAEHVLVRLAARGAAIEAAPPWPDYNGSERARALAQSKIADLTDDPRLRDALARVVNASAADEWAKLLRDPGRRGLILGARSPSRSKR